MRALVCLLLLFFSMALSAAELPPLGEQAPAWAAGLGHGAVAEVPADQVIFEIGSISKVLTAIRRVRNGTLVTSRVDTGSDLDLERLVGTCEQSAIKEALRRTHGNKSQAARVLGLSRNGLAIKMERYGLKG